MRKINKHIEIVSSSVPSLSAMNEKSYTMAQAELSKHYKKVGVTIVDTEKDLIQITQKNPDLVFLGMNSVPRKLTMTNSAPEIWLSDYLEEFGIPSTGSEGSAHSLEQDKSQAKDVVKKAGLNTAGHFVTYPGQHSNESQLPLQFPLFVKPPTLGGGKGIDDGSIVENYKDYKTRIKLLEDELGSESLVEQYLNGREFTVSILRDSHDSEYYAMPLEVIAQPGKNGVKVLGSNVKTNDTETVKIVEDLDLNEELSELALAVFDALGARDYGRIDLRMDAEGVPQFLEANLIPSLIEDYGNFHKACSGISNMSYKDMLLAIVELGLTRPAQLPESQVEIAKSTAIATPLAA